MLIEEGIFVFLLIGMLNEWCIEMLFNSFILCNISSKDCYLILDVLGLV